MKPALFYSIKRACNNSAGLRPVAVTSLNSRHGRDCRGGYDVDGQVDGLFGRFATEDEAKNALNHVRSLDMKHAANIERCKIQLSDAETGLRLDESA